MYPSTKFLHIRMIKKALSVFFAQMRLRSQLTNRCPLLRQHIESQHETLHRREEGTRVRGKVKELNLNKIIKWIEMNSAQTHYLRPIWITHTCSILLASYAYHISSKSAEMLSKYIQSIIMPCCKNLYAFDMLTWTWFMNECSTRIEFGVGLDSGLLPILE